MEKIRDFGMNYLQEFSPFREGLNCRETPRPRSFAKTKTSRNIPNVQ